MPVSYAKLILHTKHFKVALHGVVSYYRFVCKKKYLVLLRSLLDFEVLHYDFKVVLVRSLAYIGHLCSVMLLVLFMSCIYRRFL